MRSIVSTIVLIIMLGCSIHFPSALASTPAQRHQNRPKPPIRRPQPSQPQRGDCPADSLIRDVQCDFAGTRSDQSLPRRFRLTGVEMTGRFPNGGSWGVMLQRQRSNFNIVNISFLGSISDRQSVIITPGHPVEAFEVNLDFSAVDHLRLQVTCTLLPLDRTDCRNPGLNCNKACDMPREGASALVFPSPDNMDSVDLKDNTSKREGHGAE